MKNLTPSKKSLDPIEIASRDEISDLQFKRMRWSLEHAYNNVEFYKNKFDNIGIHPSDFKTLTDIEKFPFTEKKDLRENYPFKMFAVPKSQISRIHASSGTTGKPTVVGYTKGDIERWADLVARSMRASGTRPGDTVHISYDKFTGITKRLHVLPR